MGGNEFGLTTLIEFAESVHGVSEWWLNEDVVCDVVEIASGFVDGLVALAACFI